MLLFCILENTSTSSFEEVLTSTAVTPKKASQSEMYYISFKIFLEQDSYLRRLSVTASPDFGS